MVKNEGQVPQYYVEKSHPAIIAPEIFELVQQEKAKNGKGRNNSHYFTSKIICGECGEFFGMKTWHSTDKYKRKVLQCNGKYRTRSSPKCKTPHLSENQVQQAFMVAFNQIISAFSVFRFFLLN